MAADGPCAAQPQGLPLVVFALGAVCSVSGIPTHKPCGLRMMNQDCDHESHPCVSVSESWKYYIIWKGRFLDLPCSLETSDCTLVSECLRTFTPISRVLGEQRETLTTECVVLTCLLCNDLPGLHHPGSQLFGSP